MSTIQQQNHFWPFQPLLRLLIVQEGIQQTFHLSKPERQQHIYFQNSINLVYTSELQNMDGKYSLKWNDFESNASKSFDLFRNEDFLHDVTLVGDDQKQVSAHKLVLSASSDYFKNVLKNNRHPHPLFCFDGIVAEDLSNMVAYIYNGEVEIYQEGLDRFLAIAVRLKLKGLFEEGNDMVSGNVNQLKQESENIESMEESKTDLAKSETPPAMEPDTGYSPLLQELIRGKSRYININEKQMVAISGNENNKNNPEMTAKIIDLPKCDRKNSSKSFVWDHFTKVPYSGMCECHHCGKRISATNGNTTSMRKHMTSIHPHEIKESD